MENNIEIMSPVGSFESLMAAIQGGASSVYFGIGKLNMRSRSSVNFSLENLEEIVDICKQNNVKSYLTLNTVLYDDDILDAYLIIDKAMTVGVSAVIVSDMALLKYSLEKGLSIHLSTQCNVTNIEAVKYYSTYADVMVLARELNIDQITHIVNEIKRQEIKGPSGDLVKIEIFVHGALCMAISGKCYLSLDNLNVSANRGACLQICRRGYTVKDKESDIELEIDNEYIMSPKDLKTIDFIDKIIDSGVSILKIEGRGRSPEYVKTVTHCYKQAVDAYINGVITEEKINEWNVLLKQVYNRDFWGGYMFGKKIGEWSERYGSQATTKKIYIGYITNYFSKLKVAEIKIEATDLLINDKILITGPTTGVHEQIVEEIRVEDKTQTIAKQGICCSVHISNLVRRSDKVYKIVSLNA